MDDKEVRSPFRHANRFFIGCGYRPGDINRGDCERPSRSNQSVEPEMNYFIAGLLVVWFSVFSVLLVRTMIFVHRVSSCFVPEASYWKSSMRDVFEWRFWKMKLGMLATFDPADLTEAGQQYLKQGMRVERILIVWAIGGFIFIACASYRSL